MIIDGVCFRTVVVSSTDTHSHLSMRQLKRKRAKFSVPQDDFLARAAKKSTPVEDEEILSDEDVEPSARPQNAPATPTSDTPSSDSDDIPEGETAEEKRLRHARAYLRHVGVSEDAVEDAVRPQDDDNDDVPSDADNAMLREAAFIQTGRAVTRLADSISPAIQKIEPRHAKGHVLAPTCVALSADASRAVSGGKDSRVIIWDVESNTRLNVFKPSLDKVQSRAGRAAKAMGHVGSVYCAALSDDGNVVASGGDDGFVRVWDVREAKHITAMRGHRGAVQGLSLRLGSSQLFSGSSDRTVKVWDLGERAYVETLFGHGGEVTAIDSMQSERALSSGRDGTVRLYKIVEGTQLLFRSSQTMSIDSIAVINEQRFVSGGDDGSLCLWQLNKKKPTATAEHAHGRGLGCDSWVSAVSAFRSSDVAVSGGGDGHVRFWKCEDVPKLHVVGSVNLGPGFVNSIAVGRQHDVIAVALGNEHRLGRWNRIRGAKNAVCFVPFNLEGS